MESLIINILTKPVRELISFEVGVLFFGIVLFGIGIINLNKIMGGNRITSR